MRKIFTILAQIFIVVLSPVSMQAQNIELLSHDDYISAFNSTSYNKRIAYWCARVANDAYSESISNAAMSELGFQNQKLDLPESSIPIYYLINGKIQKVNFTIGLKGYIGKLNYSVNGKSVIMIAIRGSKTTSNWLSDFNAYPYSWTSKMPSVPDNIQQFFKLNDNTPEVHGGFFLCTNKIWSKIENSSFSSFIKKNDNTLFIITGHSLGGAITELLCLKLKDAGISDNNIIGYGFASPPVGDVDLNTYAGNLRSRIHKIKSNNDIVPNAGIYAYTLANQVKTIIFPNKWAIDVGGNHSMNEYLKIIESETPKTTSNNNSNVSIGGTNNNTLPTQVGTSQKFPDNNTSDRWTKKSTTVYSNWKTLAKKGTLPSGAKVRVREKITSSNGKEFAWFDPHQIGLPSGFVDAADLRADDPNIGSNNSSVSSGGTNNSSYYKATPTSISLSTPSSNQQFTSGDRINIGASITKGSEFMHYNVYIKNSSNATVYAKEQNTATSFSDYWSSTNYPAGTYNVYVVAYKTNHAEETRQSRIFTLKAQQQPQPIATQPNITISIQQNNGNGTIRVGGSYSNASHITIDCRNITNDTKISNQSVNVGNGQWYYDKPVESGKKYRFAVRAYNTNGSDKWAEIEVTAR